MKSDAQNNPVILNYLGFMYNHGLGVEKNERTGIEWYRKAAEKGLARAQFNLGLCYEYAFGTKRTYPKLLNGISRPQNRNMPLLKPKWVI